MTDSLSYGTISPPERKVQDAAVVTLVSSEAVTGDNRQLLATVMLPLCLAGVFQGRRAGQATSPGRQGSRGLPGQGQEPSRCPCTFPNGMENIRLTQETAAFALLPPGSTVMESLPGERGWSPRRVDAREPYTSETTRDSRI